MATTVKIKFKNQQQHQICYKVNHKSHKSRLLLLLLLIGSFTLISFIQVIGGRDGEHNSSGNSIVLPVYSLKVSISVPEIVKLADQFWLNCTSHHHNNNNHGQHHQSQDANQLYSIQWYKDNEEFYRYLPKEVPASLSYEAAGVKIDVSSRPTTNKL